MKKSTRINLYLKEHNITTRRGADELIQKGLVKINGVKARLGDQVFPSDVVTVDNRVLEKVQEYVYFAYNKPRGVSTTASTPGEKDILGTTTFPTAVFPVGRLDKASHGLIIMTNDGRVTDRLLNPKGIHEKEYIVETDKSIKGIDLVKMEKGIRIEREKTLPCVATKINQTTMSIIITEGKKHQVRRMCAAFGYQVEDLERIRIANITLAGLKPGMFRPFTEKEKTIFMQALGLQ